MRGGEPNPHLRLLSVLFCDMCDSTGLSARFTAEEMHELIGVYQETVVGAVKRFGGYVAQFLGDGVLAYFGWPMAYEDHAERAIRAGLAAIAGVERLKTPAGAPLQSRVGIASGRVVVGDLVRGGVPDRGQVAGADSEPRRPASGSRGTRADPDRRHYAPPRWPRFRM